MADHTFSFHLDLPEKRVAVAIGGGGNHFEAIARGFPFGPKFVAGTANPESKGFVVLAPDIPNAVMTNRTLPDPKLAVIEEDKRGLAAMA